MVKNHLSLFFLLFLISLLLLVKIPIPSIPISETEALPIVEIEHVLETAPNICVETELNLILSFLDGVIEKLSFVLENEAVFTDSQLRQEHERSIVFLNPRKQLVDFFIYNHPNFIPYL